MHMKRRLILWSSFFVWYLNDEQIKYKYDVAEDIIQLKKLLNESVKDILQLPLSMRYYLIKAKEKDIKNESEIET